MGLFGGSSSTSQNTTNNFDNRALAAGDGPAISASGNALVDVQYIPGEAFNLAGLAVETLAGVQRDTFKALGATQEAARTETAKLGEQALLIGIPALVVLLLWRG